MNSKDRAEVAEIARDAVATMFASGKHVGITFATSDIANSISAKVVGAPPPPPPAPAPAPAAEVAMRPSRNQNSSATLPITDAGIDYVNNASDADVQYTIDATMAWPANCYLQVRQGGSGSVKIALLGGTFSEPVGAKTFTAGAGDRLRLQHIGSTNVWEWV